MAGFLGSLGSFLSPALTVGTQAAAAYQGAEANASRERQQRQQQQVVQAIQMARQKHDDELKDALGQANIAHLGAETNAITNPTVKHHFTVVPSTGADGQPTYARVDTDTGEIAPTTTRLKPPTPPKDPTPHYSITPITDPKTGAIHLARVNTLTGQVDDTGVLGKQPAPKSIGGTAGMTDARLSIAKQQASDADSVMTQYEDALLSGKGKIPMAGIILAKRALKPDAMGSSAAETLLNEQYPDLANYVRAAKQVSTAERLVSPRGGSNALTQAEAALSAGGSHASDAQIQQARRFRKALISGLQGHGTQSPAGTSIPQPPKANTPPVTGNPFADLIPSGTDE